MAGYNWPQYAVHRGRFHMLLHDKLIERAGPDAVRLGHRVTGYRKNADGSVTALIERADGSAVEANGALLIGADGIHSAVRAQMHPTQPPIHWGGAVMWRGTTWGKPIRSGSSFVGLGTHRQRVVFYPISQPDPQTGLSMINWIAEVTMDNSEGWKQSGWFRQVAVSEFAHHFDGWVWDWLDVPALIRRADSAFENPMIDRDPIPTWQDGPVRADGRRRASDVSDRLERRQPGHRRCARARRLHGRARRDARGARGVRQEALRTDRPGGLAQPRRGAVRAAQPGRRALRRHVRQHRRCDPAEGARRVHGGIQGGGGVCDRKPQQGAEDDCGRARGRASPKLSRPLLHGCHGRDRRCPAPPVC